MKNKKNIKFNIFAIYFISFFAINVAICRLKANETTIPYITAETSSQLPLNGGDFTFESVKLPSLNNFPMALIALANGLKELTQEGFVPLKTLPIYTTFYPAKGFDPSKAYPTTVYLPGSAGVGLSEQNEINFLTESGQNVFVPKTNYSHVKALYDGKGVSLSDEEMAKKSSTAENQLNANPLNQVADSMRLLRILENAPFVDSDNITLLGNSLGGVSAVLAKMPEISGPLTPGARRVTGPKGQEKFFDDDVWSGVPNFTAVATSALPPIMLFLPHVDQRLIIFSGDIDNYCEVEPMIHAMQKAMKGLNVSFEILEGVGHFPEASKVEYQGRVQKSKNGGIVYRQEREDFYMKNGQNLSKACFRLAQKISFFEKQEGEDMGAYMDRVGGATFFHTGTGAWDKAEEKSLLQNFGSLAGYATRGTSIKPDDLATQYIHERTKELQILSDAEFMARSCQQSVSIQGYDEGVGSASYKKGFITRQAMEEYLEGK